MSLHKKVKDRIESCVWDIWHEKRCKEYRTQFHNPDVSIISSSCIGGILLHDLKVKFQSPTVNLYFRAADFMKFCENLNYYMAIEEMNVCTDKHIIEDRKYPIAYLGDLLLFLVHYSSVNEAQLKWNERKRRMNWDNIVVIHTDREGMTDEIKDRFEQLPYRKVMFVHKPDTIHKSCVYIKGYEKQKQVGIITEHKGTRGRRPIDQFDWVGFLNGNVSMEKQST